MPGLVKFGEYVLKKKIFKIRQCIFAFSFYLPWKRMVPFIWTNLNPHQPSITCQVWLKLAQWSWRRWFFNFNIFSLLPYPLLLEKDNALPFNKLKSPSPKYSLCQVWLKWAQWFWRRRRFSYFVNVFFCNVLIIGPSFEQTWISINQCKDDLCQC